MAIRITMHEAAKAPVIEWLISMALLALAYAGMLRRKKEYQAYNALMTGAETMLFQPELAALIGLDEAIILQKIWEWMEYNRRHNKRSHYRYGKWWTGNGYRQWHAQHFRWISWQTVAAKLKNLEAMGLLMAEAIQPGDSTRFYTLSDLGLKLQGGVSILEQGSLSFRTPPSKIANRVSEFSDTTKKETNKKTKKGIKVKRRGAAEKISSINGGIDGADFTAAREPADEPPPVSALPPSGEGEGGEHENAWRVAHQQMELLFGTAFDTWLKRAEYRGYADGRMTVRVQTEDAVQRCQYVLYRNIMRVVSDVCPDVKAITFVTQEGAAV